MEQTQTRYEAALETLVQDVKNDDHILAAILCGSLAYDEVWDKSDIDLVLICTDDKQTKSDGVSLCYDSINIHTTVKTRSAFRQALEASTHNTFHHSLFAKAKLLYSRDPTIEDILKKLHNIGDRDRKIHIIQSTQEALSTLYKARKWLEIKNDLPYTALWLLFTANSLAQVEVSLAGELVTREVLADAYRLNPALFQMIYKDLLERKLTRTVLTKALRAVEDYLTEKAESIFKPVIEFLDEAEGEPRSVTEITHYFERHYNINVLLGCEWLSDVGAIDKASLPVKLTIRSQVHMEELAFFHIPSHYGR